MVSKKTNIKGIWKLVKLSEEEEEEVLTALAEKNLKELSRCIKIALNDEIRHKYPEILYLRFETVVKMLYDKQATASFTALNEALEKKIEKLNQIQNQQNERDSLIESTFKRASE